MLTQFKVLASYQQLKLEKNDLKFCTRNKSRSTSISYIRGIGIIIVCQSWLWADLGLPTMCVCVCVCVCVWVDRNRTPFLVDQFQSCFSYRLLLWSSCDFLKMKKNGSPLHIFRGRQKLPVSLSINKDAFASVPDRFHASCLDDAGFRC